MNRPSRPLADVTVGCDPGMARITKGRDGGNRLQSHEDLLVAQTYCNSRVHCYTFLRNHVIALVTLPGPEPPLGRAQSVRPRGVLAQLL